jgi:hypothetical protein
MRARALALRWWLLITECLNLANQSPCRISPSSSRNESTGIGFEVVEAFIMIDATAWEHDSVQGEQTAIEMKSWRRSSSCSLRARISPIINRPALSRPHLREMRARALALRWWLLIIECLNLGNQPPCRISPSSSRKSTGIGFEVVEAFIMIDATA